MTGHETLLIVPGSLDLASLARCYREPCKVEVDPESRGAVDGAAEIVSRAAGGDQAVYGVNTGFGKLASTRIGADDTAALQRNLILSHCCGVGDPLPDPVVRLLMVLKVNSLGRGASGVRWRVLQQIVWLLNAGILPLIPSQGSVGASGDLAPLAHMSAAMMGEGEVRVNGEVLSADKALVTAEIEPLELGPKEGLGLINGTQVSTALALAGYFDAWQLAGNALVTGAMASDALMASTAPFRQEVHELRGHGGQIDAARALRDLLSGSEIRESHRENDSRVQDPYCLRCQPQVMGACIDQLRQVARTLEIEANAVTDNPLVIRDGGEILSGGNFHAEPVAFAADQVAIAVAEMGAICERRIATLVDPALNYGLPAFLSPEPGLNSGFMVAEITAAALMAENRQKAMPCSVDSTPTSANQEDHVSMACHGARRLGEMNRNLAQIIAIELLAASQGIGFRSPLQTGTALRSIIKRLRERVPALQADRYMANELQIAAELVSGAPLVEDPELLPAIREAS